ncbi:cation:proton antiporter [Gephyromycinifex aptenodytis]|uniref:cation:proton antiporter n=1 Tax=Gephyromycinifex aptenodytis TaxID=2716227 RepID=UPI001447AF39|nr:monovalent cation/H(+) antiporter subunit G [Gephyromycinifex aptenodytis]
MIDIVLDVIISVACVLGALFVLLSAAAMLRTNDALSRINVLSPATGVGLPLIVIAAYIHSARLHGFDVWALVQLVVTLVALLVVSSVASNTLSRAAYLSGARVDPRTHPQELAEPPAGTDDESSAT